MTSHDDNNGNSPSTPTHLLRLLAARVVKCKYVTFGRAGREYNRRFPVDSRRLTRLHGTALVGACITATILQFALDMRPDTHVHFDAGVRVVESECVYKCASNGESVSMVEEGRLHPSILLVIVVCFMRPRLVNLTGQCQSQPVTSTL